MRCFAALLACLLTTVTGAEEATLVLEGLQPAYASLSDVQVRIRSMATVQVHLDVRGGDEFEIERWSRDTGAWEAGYRHHCFYDGSISLDAGGSFDLKVDSLGAFTTIERESWFEPAKGSRRPIPGRYRLRAQYSVRPWSGSLNRPREMEEVVSLEFEIGDGR